VIITCAKLSFQLTPASSFPNAFKIVLERCRSPQASQSIQSGVDGTFRALLGSKRHQNIFRDKVLQQGAEQALLAIVEKLANGEKLEIGKEGMSHIMFIIDTGSKGHLFLCILAATSSPEPRRNILDKAKKFFRKV
jgi:hypothetical protein